MTSMTKDFTKKIAILSVLAASIIAYGVLNEIGMLRDAEFSSAVMAIMLLVSAATNPRQEPRKFRYIGHIGLVIIVASIFVALSNLILYLADLNPMPRGFSWIALIGLGFVAAVTIKRSLLLLDYIQDTHFSNLAVKAKN
jgi:hypothetical protein